MPDSNESTLSFNERLAVRLTALAGSMRTAYVLVAFYVVWSLVNTLLGAHAIDPFPYPFLTFLSNALQLWWLPVLSVGQYVVVRQGKKRQQENDQLMRNQSHMMEAMVGMMKRQNAVLEEDLAEDRRTLAYLRQSLGELSGKMEEAPDEDFSD